MKWMSATTALLCLLLTTGCATSRGPQESAGMVIGGMLGGLLGAQVEDSDMREVAIIAGTLAGAAIGGRIGQSMDDTDRLRAGQTLETVRTGVSTAWHNPDSGIDYQFTPTRTYERDTGPCREYSVKARIDGRVQDVVGTACREPDGTWRVR